MEVCGRGKGKVSGWVGGETRRRGVGGGEPGGVAGEGEGGGGGRRGGRGETERGMPGGPGGSRVGRPIRSLVVVSAVKSDQRS